ncbi:MAG: hypothetical protein ABIK62_04200 [candidate division WOR-3 bacterium]
MRYLLLALLPALLIIFFACPPVTELGTPQNVTKQALESDNGGTLKISWDAVTDAEGYEIYFDGSTTADTTVTTTSVSISTPCKKIEIAAYKGSTKGEKATVDVAPVVTQSVTVYYISDPTNTSHAIKFSADGACIATVLGSDIEFVLDDTTTDNNGNRVPGFWSPDMYATPYNGHDNGAGASLGSNFNTVTAAPNPTTGDYLTRRAIVEGGVYPLWIDPTANNWSSDDHFAKALVQSISGTTITLKVAYQKVGGLRWLVTE